MFRGTNGNASLRFPKPYDDIAIITATKTLKGHARLSDISVWDLRDNQVFGKELSSESQIHQLLFAKTQAKCVLHAHTPYLLALSCVCPIESIKTLPIYEVALLPFAIGFVGRYQPGSTQLANAVAQAFEHLAQHNASVDTKGCLWMDGHGLLCWGEDMLTAFGILEEMEHLAMIALHGRSS